MQFRPEQLETISEERRDAFIDRLTPLLQELLPEYFLDLPPAQARLLAPPTPAKPCSSESVSNPTQANYVQMRIEAGPEFETGLIGDDSFPFNRPNNAYANTQTFA